MGKKSNKLVTNIKDTSKSKKRSLQRVTFNLSSPVRHDEMEGRSYLVVPMVMLTEGVHSGSNGPLFYPKEEIEKLPAVWNCKPIVVYHPQKDGQGISACDPDVLNNRRIGQILNTTAKNGKLHAEAWLEEDRIKAVDDRILDAIENNKMMEVSTGLFTDNEVVDGEWNGEEYVAIARNYRPDHLAILPDQVGACSIADGAGLLRLNQAASGSGPLAKAAKALLDLISFNEMSHDELYGKLRDALDAKEGNQNDMWIRDVYDDFFIYHNDSKLFMLYYKIVQNDGVELVGTPEEVKEEKYYYKVSDNTILNESRKETVMNKKQIVDALIKNGQWTEEDREFLMNMADDKLKKMAPVSNDDDQDGDDSADDAPAEPKAPATAAEPAAVPSAPAQNADAKQPTFNEWLQQAPVQYRDVVLSGVQSYNKERAQQINIITANKANTFTAEQLKSKGLDELRALAALAAVPSAPAVPSYDGMMDIQVDNQGISDEEPLTAPVMNFEEQK